MPLQERARLRRSSKAALDLPPPFRLMTLREVGDAFAHATDVAGEEGAGTLVHGSQRAGFFLRDKDPVSDAGARVLEISELNLTVLGRYVFAIGGNPSPTLVFSGASRSIGPAVRSK